MSNMSYCRFINTLADLRDCYDNIDDRDISQEEMVARDRLITLCTLISLEYDDLENG